MSLSISLNIEKNETTESNMPTIKMFLSYPSNPKKVQELHVNSSPSHSITSHHPNKKNNQKFPASLFAPEVQVAKSLQYSNQWTLNVVEPGSIPEWRPRRRPLQRRLPRPTGHTDLVSHRRTKGEYPAGRDEIPKYPAGTPFLKTGSFITYTCCGMETGQ